jgi:hypothetical protein
MQVGGDTLQDHSRRVVAGQPDRELLQDFPLRCGQPVQRKVETQLPAMVIGKRGFPFFHQDDAIAAGQMGFPLALNRDALPCGLADHMKPGRLAGVLIRC